MHKSCHGLVVYVLSLNLQLRTGISPDHFIAVSPLWGIGEPSSREYYEQIIMIPALPSIDLRSMHLHVHTVGRESAAPVVSMSTQPVEFSPPSSECCFLVTHEVL